MTTLSDLMPGDTIALITLVDHHRQVQSLRIDTHFHISISYRTFRPIEYQSIQKAVTEIDKNRHCLNVFATYA